MAVNNSLVKKKETFSAYLSQDAIKQKINEMVGGKEGQQFITSILSAVSANSELQKCNYGSIVSAALLGQSLKLSPSPQLGQYFFVPYQDKKQGLIAQFQIGYKGYIQLAIRSGFYKKMNVIAIKENELIKYDPLNEEIKANLIEDDDIREESKTIGYYAMFEYNNGFRKTMYWSAKKMKRHAQKYSQAYRSDLNKNTQYSFWSKDFDSMAFKTMLRQLISKWGVMSIEMQNAIEKDMAVIKENGDYEYVDNENIIEGEGGVVEQKDITEEDKHIPATLKAEKRVDKTEKATEQMEQVEEKSQEEIEPIRDEIVENEHFEKEQEDDFFNI